MPDCYITNPEITKWYKTQNERNEKRDEETLLMTIFLVIQLGIYFNRWKHELERLENVVNKLICLKRMVHRADIDVDYPWMKKKQDVLYLPVPLPEMCSDAKLYESQVMCEGKGVDEKATRYANEDCNGIPKGWDVKEGRGYAALAQSYTGSVLANSAKRRMEKFQSNKIKLVLSAQNSARMDLRPAINDLNLSLGIHSRLSEIYAQGFNSAGLGLGSILRQNGAV